MCVVLLHICRNCCRKLKSTSRANTSSTYVPRTMQLSETDHFYSPTTSAAVDPDDIRVTQSSTQAVVDASIAEEYAADCTGNASYHIAGGSPSCQPAQYAAASAQSAPAYDVSTAGYLRKAKPKPVRSSFATIKIASNLL